MKCVALMVMKAEMARAQRLRMTWTVKFHLKTMSDEEIDTIVIEEEDWIEYIKRSTEYAMEKMERAKIRCWNRTR